MALEQGVCASFFLELHQAIHDFDNDQFKVALYKPAATLTPDTTAYTTENEVDGAGYVAGGMDLVFIGGTPALAGRNLILSISQVTWPSVSITTRGALLYNSSKANRSWAVIDFGHAVTVAAEPFTLPQPLINGVMSIYQAYQPS